MEHRAVPHTDFLSWTKEGKPWVDFEWGAQLALYGLERTGGDRALWLFKSGGFLLLLVCLLLLLRRWKTPVLWSAAVLPIMALVFAPYLNARPEMFSVFLCLAQFALLEELREGRLQPSRALFISHALFYALWANLHGAFPVGLGLCVLYGLEGGFLGRANLGLAFCGLAGTLLNPYGLDIYRVFIEHAQHKELLRRHIIEWSDIPISSLAMVPYWALLLFSFGVGLAAVWQGVILPRAHLAALLVLGLFGSSHFRHSIYVPLLLVPLALKIALGLSAPAGLRRVIFAAAAVLALGAGWAGWEITRATGGLRLALNPDLKIPFEACTFLRREKAVLGGLKLYNGYNWGGFLGYELYPDYKVFMDGRYLFADMLAEPHPPAGGAPAWRRLVERYGIQMALIEIHRPLYKVFRGQLSPWRPFDVYTMPRSEWALVYWDDLAMFFVKREAVPADWLARHEFRHLRPGDLQVLGRRVVAGQVPYVEVAREIERFRRQANAPLELTRLDAWRTELRRELGLK